MQRQQYSAHDVSGGPILPSQQHCTDTVPDWVLLQQQQHHSDLSGSKFLPTRVVDAFRVSQSIHHVHHGRVVIPRLHVPQGLLRTRLERTGRDVCRVSNRSILPSCKFKVQLLTQYKLNVTTKTDARYARCICDFGHPRHLLLPNVQPKQRNK